MNCETARTEMQTALDTGQDQLSGVAADHVAECDSCRAHWQQLCCLDDAMSPALNDGVTMPGGLHENLMDRLAREETWESTSDRSARARWLLAIVAAVIIAGIVGVLTYPSQRAPSQRAAVTPSAGILSGASPTSVVTGILSNPIADLEKASPTRAIAEAGASVREFGVSILSPASAALRALQIEEPSVHPGSTPRAVD